MGGQSTTTASITPKSLNIVANDTSKASGSADPALTWSIAGSGLVAGDTLAGSLSRASGEAPGTYSINKGTLGNGNYDVNLTGGVFTITGSVSTPSTPSTASTPSAPQSQAVTPAQYTFAPVTLQTPTAGELTYMAVSGQPETTAATASDDAQRVPGADQSATPVSGQVRLASQAASAGQDAKFLNVLVVSGGIKQPAAPSSPETTPIDPTAAQ
ncbi:MBG domain-containing protein [Burkholderia sp. 8Y]|uniref:MBG domain-containing protein n=1 Tax=Burkholderia sp. 8Y TaxID=2653133 RepID=UPI0022A7C271|nr:MBG domain-containing protein [Burkholderia sp. 8Y]